jgi:hypothetical protein
VSWHLPRNVGVDGFRSTVTRWLAGKGSGVRLAQPGDRLRRLPICGT